MSMQPATESGAARYVLVVEDDHDLRSLYREILEDAGYDVRAATDGLEALDVLEQVGAPAVVVLDLRMPRMDGWTLAERLRQSREWSRAAIVVVAAHYQIREEARSIGATAWLHKPVSIDDLVNTVRRAYRGAAGSATS